MNAQEGALRPKALPEPNVTPHAPDAVPFVIVPLQPGSKPPGTIGSEQYDKGAVALRNSTQDTGCQVIRHTYI